MYLKKMDRPESKIGSYSWLSIFLTIATTACSPAKIATVPLISPAPTTQALEPSQPPLRQNEGEIYQQALSKADAANAIEQSASSKEDWFLVVHNLEDSVQMLKSIAPNTAQYILAAKVLPKYERELAIAKQKAANFVSKSDPSLVSSEQIATALQSDTFSIPIEEKLGGVPVITVTFNDRQKVSMLLDTGASRTLVPKSIVDRLQLKTTGSSQAKTANGTASFPTTTIDKIKFGDGETKEVVVAIGQNDLPYGLLGHDVYDGYDITIKENSIEFRKR